MTALPKRLVAKPRAGKPSRMMTSEEFLDWLEPGIFADLIAGEIAMHSPVNFRHAQLTNFLERLLAAYLEETDLPGQLHRDVVAVRLSARDTFLPDLCFFTPHQVALFAEAHAPVAPMFCVEVLSPSTAKNDLGSKFAAYELHGVQEYWVLDPQKLAHRFFRREGDLFVQFAETAARIESATIRGFSVRRAWLDPEKLPKVSTCLRDILNVRRRR
jgi:Uma2 family endonuclease